MSTSKHLKFAAYVTVFVVGMWGSNILIKQTLNNSEGNQVEQAMVKQPAPEFNLPDIDGVIHNSQEWDGKIVILNFWATWCPPCRKETPVLVETQEQYGPAGIQLIGVAIDKKDDVLEFMDTYGINYPMLIGEDNAIKITKDYGNKLGVLPYTVVINRQGQIHFVQRGEIKRETIEKNIKQLL